ncbi:MAG: lysophospholipid acyltransferase family protein [Planctomycetota bacterium]
MAVRFPRAAYPVLGELGRGAVRLLMHTTRISAEWAAGAEWATGRGAQCIFVFWHGKLLVPAYMCRDFGIRVMISLARDGEYISRVVERMGFAAVRGSSSRGGVGALEAMVRELEGGVGAAITPDGPRGPRRVFQPGAIYLAQLSGTPLVPTAVAIRHAWEMPSWDRFEVPMPFTRIHMVIGAPIWVDREFPRERVEGLSERLREIMVALDAEARRFLDMGSDEEEADA